MTSTPRQQKILHAYSYAVHEFVNVFTPLYVMPSKFRLPEYESKAKKFSRSILALVRLLLKEMGADSLEKEYALFLNAFANLELALRQNNAVEVKAQIGWLAAYLTPLLSKAEAKFNVTGRSGRESIVQKAASW